MFTRVPAHALLSITALGLIAVAGWPTATAAQAPAVQEHFSEPAFAASVQQLSTVGFDGLTPGDGVLSGNEFVGLTVVQLDGLPMNVVQNSVPGSHGSNFVTEANVASFPNAISASVSQSLAQPGTPDNFEFVLGDPVSAAGVFVGNIGNCSEFTPPNTVIQFIDLAGAVLAETAFAQSHPAVIFGDATSAFCGGASPVPFDNGVFYGLTTDAAVIKTIRVLNPPADADTITIDDVSYGISLAAANPFDRLCALIEAIEGLRAEGLLNQGRANSLIVKLEAAKASLERDHNHVAQNQLIAFANEAEAIIPKKLSEAQGRPLVEEANAIWNLLNSW